MNPEEALLDYLYSRLVEVLPLWKGLEDIYGIWIILSLYEDDPRRPSFSHLMPLRDSIATAERIESYGGSRWETGVADYTQSISFGCCADPWPPLEDRDGYYDENGFHDGDPEGLQLREQFFAWKQAQTGYVPPSDPGDQIRNPELNSFLGICGALIHRLHADGTLVALYGHTVPLGISFSNDVNREIALPATRDNNPNHLSQGMEEWMLGNTYVQIAGEATFRAELQTKPARTQAAWWRDALRGYWAWVHQSGTSPEWEEAKQAGFTEIRPDWEGSAGAPLALLLIEEIAGGIRVLPPMQCPTPSEQEILEAFLLELTSLDRHAKLVAAIPESTIVLLFHTLQRLYQESKGQVRIGVALQLTASALHSLRPERFPAVKFGGRRENAHRLLEPERFGLMT